MTFRENIAEWISGGALSRERRRADDWMVEAEKCYDSAWKHFGESLEFHTALHQIAAQETPSANATVKRMAKIAKDALK